MRALLALAVLPLVGCVLTPTAFDAGYMPPGGGFSGASGGSGAGGGFGGGGNVGGGGGGVLPWGPSASGRTCTNPALICAVVFGQVGELCVDPTTPTAIPAGAPPCPCAAGSVCVNNRCLSPCVEPFGVPVGTRSSPIALMGSSFVAVNPDDATLVLASLGTGVLVGALQYPRGSEPEAVSCNPNLGVCWVALRGSGEVSMVALSGGPLREVRRVPVGAEPTALALSPWGTWLVVATFGEQSVAIVDTATGFVSHVDVGGHPRAVAFSNNGDAVDTDERAYVTLFFGVPTTNGMHGVVKAISAGANSVVDSFEFGSTQGCDVNQLSAVAEAQGSLYVAYQCTLPRGGMGPKVDTGVAVLNTATRAVGTMTLALTHGQALPDPSDLSVRAQLSGLHELTVVSRGTSSWTVLSFSAGSTNTPDGGELFQTCGGYGGGTVAPLNGALCIPPPPPAGGLIPLDGGAVGYPTSVPGLITAVLPTLSSGRDFLTYDRTGHSAGTFAARVGLGNHQPTVDDESEQTGRLHFQTALGRWSTPSGLISCASCHPDGLTDGLTWSFSTGPRQTIPVDGTFAKADPRDHRVQNWTGVADELADVEGLVRTFMGGLGALTISDGGSESRLPLDLGLSLGGGPLTRNDGLSGSSLALSQSLSTVHDWEHIDFWVQHVRTTAGSTQQDGGAVLRGRAVFVAAGCHTCHGGAKWTVSRVPYQPSAAVNGSAPGAAGSLPTVATGLRTQLRDGGTLPFSGNVNNDTFKVDVEHVALADGGTASVGPERITCVLRNVGTYDGGDPLEVTSTLGTAQGALGFNVPSLLGVGTTAPYFHSGAAATLTELLSPRFARHFSLGSAAFVPDAGGGDLKDLEAFLLTIDGTTEPIAVPAGYDICGGY